MKILGIRGANLASLAAPFALDLEHGPLAGAGLFAITGPVGAGKSTLLDALCLALFDRTPRLAGQRGAVGDPSTPANEWLATGDPRSLLRRDARDGFAEVDFRGRDGVRYRARWSCHRARRASARLQQQQLRLVDLDRDVVVAAGSRTEVLAAIQQRLGLDFGQFCRSVLLAQGEFAAFLRAKPEERAKLLETLTGADVYRRLSRAAHERARASRAELERLRGQLDAQAPLDDAARSALDAELARCRGQLDAARAGVVLASRYVQWYDVAEQHRQREADAMDALQHAVRTNDAAEPRRRQLVRRQRALAVVPRFEAAQAAAAAAAVTARAADVAGRDLAAATAACAAAHAAFAAAAAPAFGPAAIDAAAAAPLVHELPRWEPLLLQWQRAEAAIVRATGAARAAAPALARAERERADLEPEHAAAAHALQVALDTLEHARRAASEHDGERLAAARRQLDAAARTAAARHAAAVAWAGAATDVVHTRQRLDAAAVAIVRTLELADAAAAELLRADTAAAAAAAARTAAHERAGLAAWRTQLVDGEPCALCGARVHDVAHAVADDAAIAAAAGAAAAAQQAAARARTAATAALSAHHAAVHAHAEARTAHDARAAALAAAAAAAQRACVESDTGEPRAEPAAPATDPAAAIAAATEALDAVDAARTSLAAADAAAHRASAALQRAVAAGDAAHRAWQALVQRQQHVQRRRDDAAAAVAAAHDERARELQRLADLRAALQPACGELPDGVGGVERLGPARLDVLRTLHAAHGRVAAAARHHAACTAAAARTATACADADADVERTQRALAKASVIEQVDAADVAAAAELGADALAAAAHELQQLATTVETTRAVLRERADQRKAHERHDRPSLDAADAAVALDDTRRAAAAVEQRLLTLQAELSADEHVRRHRAELLPRLHAAEAAQQAWLALDELIGSSTGDTFAVFAQELTLDLLLLEANRRLVELARRYRLRRNPAGPLDFVVVDLDLGGTARSVWTLSGGETFLVSLALALALATLAAPRSRVETLFLDEGFGTLDAHALELALGALDSLQATGCQVGIISHVDGIAERIGAQVVVQPGGGGQSRVVATVR